MDIVVIFLEGNEFTVLVEAVEEHFEAVIDAQREPLCVERHQNLKVNIVHALLMNGPLVSHDLL